jgi:hypothetical protein
MTVLAKSIPRFLLGFAALLLAIGAILHASAFNKISSALENSNLGAFAANSLKVLWVADSATSIILAALFGLVAVQPAAATRGVIVLTALIPAATAVCIYTFIGSFIGAHILFVAAIAAILGGLQFPGSESAARS